MKFLPSRIDIRITPGDTGAMTNTDKAVARYVRIGGVESEAREIIADAIKVCPAMGYMVATLMQFQMATVATVERIAEGILAEAAA